MELFLELVSTVALSLLFAFLVAKILSGSSSSSSSSSTCGDDHDGSAVFLGASIFEAESERHGFEGEGGAWFVEDGDMADSRKERFVLEERLNENEMGVTCDDVVKIDENKGLREVGVVGLVEKVIEERECEQNMVVQSIDSQTNVNFGIVFSKDGILDSETKYAEDDNGKGGVFECKEISVESGNIIAEAETECSKGEVGAAKGGDREIFECGYDKEMGDGNKNGKDVLKEVSFDEDDDWEGIERTELERVFGAAVAFVGSKSNADRVSSLGGNVMKQLYGLHKVATEGPCHESQPMALKVSARANWNAWKQLGNMAPEVAMEQYVTILLKSIPGCIQDDIGGEIKQNAADADAYSKLASDLKTWQRSQLGSVDERTIDDIIPFLEGFDATGSLVHIP